MTLNELFETREMAMSNMNAACPRCQKLYKDWTPLCSCPVFITSDGTMHEKCKLYFMVGSDLISEGEVDPGSLPDLGYRRTGTAYVCPDCAHVWATAILVNSSGAQCPFEVTAVACEKHHSQWHVPGSLLSGYRNEHYLPLLSTKALKREFILHHKWIRK